MRSCEVFSKSLWWNIAPNAFWVNPLNSRERASLKPVQLVEAVRSGLKIPPTLCSSDPAKIRQFIADQEGDVIYKTLVPTTWQSQDEIVMIFTTVVTLEDLPEDDILRLSPGIFQKRIAKNHELRLTYMGDRCVAARLNSQKDPLSEVDWRIPGASFEIVPEGRLPNSLDQSCRSLMRSLGIVFGCFDFVVTPRGDHVFLEVNHAGQFLWLEEQNPDIMLLDSFCDFLIQKTERFKWSPSEASLRYADFVEQALELQEKHDVQHHLAPRVPWADDSGEEADGLRLAKAEDLHGHQKEDESRVASTS